MVLNEVAKYPKNYGGYAGSYKSTFLPKYVAWPALCCKYLISHLFYGSCLWVPKIHDQIKILIEAEFISS